METPRAMFDQCVMKLIWSFFRTELDYLGKSREKKKERDEEGVEKELILFQRLEWNSFHGVRRRDPLNPLGYGTFGRRCTGKRRRQTEMGFKHIIQAISWLFSSTQHTEGAPVNLLQEIRPEWHLYGISDMKRKVVKLWKITPPSIKITRRRTVEGSPRKKERHTNTIRSHRPCWALRPSRDAELVLFPFGIDSGLHFVPGPQWASNCENDSIYKIIS